MEKRKKYIIFDSKKQIKFKLGLKFKILLDREEDLKFTDLSYYTGISYFNLFLILKGIKNPNIIQFKNLCKVFFVSSDGILDLDTF